VDAVSSLLSNVDNLRFTDTNALTDPNVAAAKAHERVVKLTTFDGKTYTIAMGRKPEEKKLKPPTEGKTGPTAMGSVEDLAKKEAKGADKQTAPKPVTPQYDTIPAGPVFAFVTSSDSSAPVNGLMQKRAFQVGDYIFTSLPQKPADLFEPAPTPPATPPTAPKPDAAKPAAPSGPEPAKK
ncbi:MAG TPA: hypothetical protein VHE61_18700, partial [Opitutaceae bacterium]|nr:hypothetical protein [Opitutaceae bacterium]